jgi:RNA polymerase sigma factor (sigma-70 family)
MSAVDAQDLSRPGAGAGEPNAVPNSVPLDMEVLQAEHGAFLLALAHTITWDWHEAEDIVQSTLEIAIRNGGRLRETGALRAWLMRIETREAFRLRRRLKRFVPLESHVEELSRLEAPRGPHDHERSLDVRLAIRRLPPRTRAALMLHYYADLSVDETAAALGVSPNTIKTQLRKGLGMVREALR